jgi:predicted RND superfamily exporter protein
VTDDTTVIARLVRTVVRRKLVVLALTVLVLAGSIALAARMKLVTDLAELLPARDPAVVATRRVQERLGGVAPLQIAIESPDRAANLRLAEALTATLGRESRALVDRAAHEVHAERQFFARNWWLYVESADLALVRDRLVREVRWRKNPLLVDLEDDAGLDALEARLTRRVQAADRFPDGTFSSADGQLVVIMVWPAEALFREHAGERLVTRVKQLIEEQPVPAGMRIELAGALYDAILERRALESDLAWTSLACVVLVSLVVALFFGRLRAVPLMALPAFAGVAIAFAVGSLAFGQLNASTAFLGSIILGSGINTAIIQLARYDEERRAGESVAIALERSVATTIRGTATAALAAALAYGSLTLTEFRGFSQFGVIGAVGMVAAWGATIVVLPALVATLDRERAPTRRLAFGVPFAKLAGRAPTVIGIAGIAITVAAVAIVVPYARDPFEYDLRRLRSIQAAERRELGKRIEAIFRTFTPTVVLADRPDQVSEIAATLRERAARTPGVIGDVLTLDDLVPARQGEKLALVDEIRGLVTEADAPELAKWKPAEGLVEITAQTLPDTLVRPFRDVRGELAPIVLVYRAEQLSYWNGRDLMRLAELVGTVELADGSVVHAGGSAVVFAGMIEAIVRDGPTATLASLAAVALLVLVLARGLRGALVVLAALLTGVLWLLGAAALAGVRVNFLNFIALPLTFGIGVDYAVNLLLRHRLDGPGRLLDTLRATGGAVALCSVTTTIGYASLLFADSQGLRSFGALAILGELSCMTVALVVMPAWLARSSRAVRLDPS